MHEAAIAQSLIEGVQQVLEAEAPGERLRRVHLRIGALTAVVPDMLEFAFEALVAGTSLEGARLVITEVPVRARCTACGAEDEITDIAFLCGRCASPEVEITQGRELVIDSLEVGNEP